MADYWLKFAYLQELVNGLTDRWTRRGLSMWFDSYWALQQLNGPLQYRTLGCKKNQFKIR